MYVDRNGFFFCGFSLAWSTFTVFFSTKSKDKLHTMKVYGISSSHFIQNRVVWNCVVSVRIVCSYSRKIEQGLVVCCFFCCYIKHLRRVYSIIMPFVEYVKWKFATHSPIDSVNVRQIFNIFFSEMFHNDVKIIETLAILIVVMTVALSNFSLFHFSPSNFIELMVK